MSVWHTRDGRVNLLGRLWNTGNHLLLRLRLVDCLYCNNTGDGCDCGADDISYEISGGAHYQWCMFYNGCRMCKRVSS